MSTVAVSRPRFKTRVWERRKKEGDTMVKNLATFLALSAVIGFLCSPRFFPGTPQLTSSQSEFFSDNGDSPNWVSSHTAREDNYVRGFAVRRGFSIERLATFLDKKFPRTTIVTETDGYLHMEFQTAIIGFVDDVEFIWESDGTVLAIKSASRRGYSDLGENMRRYEKIYKELHTAQIVYGQVDSN